MKILKPGCVLLIVISLIMPDRLKAQTVETSQLQRATLPQLVEYALQSQPKTKQALLDEEIGEREINSALSGWLPPDNASANCNHNLKQAVSPLTMGGETTYITMRSEE